MIGPLQPGREALRRDVAALLEVLERLADHATYGSIRRRQNPALIGLDYAVHLEWPPLPHAERVKQSSQRAVEESAALDAFAAQLIPTSATSRAPRSRWDITSLGAKSLAVSKDLDAWLGSPRVEPDVLETARRDLEAALNPKPTE